MKDEEKFWVMMNAWGAVIGAALAHNKQAAINDWNMRNRHSHHVATDAYEESKEEDLSS